MYRSIVLSVTRLILLLCFGVNLCSPSSIPLSFSPVVADPVGFDLQARLLSDVIDCDFDDVTFCHLHNNGGWSFQRSFSDHEPRIVPTTVETNFPSPKLMNHYVCADWREIAFTNESIRRSAVLQAFIPLPLPSQFFIKRALPFPGRARLGSAQNFEKVKQSEISRDSGLCLDLRVRFSSNNNSKLTVKFRSSSQTIEVTGMSESRVVSSETSSFQEKLTFWGYLAGWVISLPFTFSSFLKSHLKIQSSHRSNPPKEKWLHFIMPLDTHLFHSDSPLPFSLYGYNGVCIDSLRVEECTTVTLPSLSWPPNNTLFFTPYLTSMADFSTNISIESFNSLFTGAFLFYVVLVILLILLILICVISVVCGRSVIKNKHGKLKNRNFPTVLPSIDLTRSASVSSLPSAVVHQRPFEGIFYSLVEKCEGTCNNACSHDNDFPCGGLRRPKKRLNQPTSVDGDRGKLLHHCRGLRREIPIRKRVTMSETTNSCSVFHRFSLLSINENNELVLVSPENANSSSATPTHLNEGSNELKNGALTNNVVEGSAVMSDSGVFSFNGISTTPIGTHNSGRLLSSLEAVKTLKEMAASVSQLGREVREGNDGDCDKSDSSSSVEEFIRSSISCLPPNMQLTK